MLAAGTDSSGKWMSVDNIETFSKLIVQDCISIVEGYCEDSPEIYGLPLEILDHFDMELDV